MKELIKVQSPIDDEEYTLYVMEHDPQHWFLQNKLGEGMGFKYKDMFELLDDFFKVKF